MAPLGEEVKKKCTSVVETAGVNRYCRKKLRHMVPTHVRAQVRGRYVSWRQGIRIRCSKRGVISTVENENGCSPKV